MTQEKRRSMLLGLCAMTLGIGFGFPLADDMPSRVAPRYRRSRGGVRPRKRDFAESIAFVLQAIIAVGGVIVGGNLIRKALKKG